MKNRYKVYNDYAGSFDNVHQGKKSEEEVERDLTNFPGDLKSKLNVNDEVVVLERHYSDSYINIEVSFSLTEFDFQRIFEHELLKRLLMAMKL